jgi:hypothetical protein
LHRRRLIRPSSGRLLASLAAVLSILAFVPFAAAAIDLRGDFETGNTSQWEGFEYHGVFTANYPQSNQLQIVTSPVRQGRYAAKFVVNPGDQYGGSSGERALLRFGDARCSCESEGEDFYYSWSSLFPTDWSSPPGWAQILEFHGDSRFLLAPIRFNAAGDSLSVDLTTGQCSSAGQCAYMRNTPVLSTLSKGKWNDFVLHVRWTKSSNGVVDVWHRLEGSSSWNKVADLSGIPTLPWLSGQADPTVYILFGLYTGNGSTARSLYGDAFSRATSFDEAASVLPMGAPAPATTQTPPPAPPPTAVSPTPATTPAVTPPPSAGPSAGAAATVAVPQAPQPAAPIPAGAPSDAAAQATPDPVAAPTPAAQPQLAPASLAPASLGPAPKVRQLGAALSVPVVRPKLRDSSYLRTTLSVSHVTRLVVSVTRSGRRVPLLAHSRVGETMIGYWRKAIVVRPAHDGRLRVALRVPTRLLARDRVVLRARVEGARGSRQLAIAVAAR